MSDRYLDSTLTPEERAVDLLAKLSIEEKVAQLCGTWMQNVDMPGELEDGIGHVSTLEMRRKTSLEECVDWQIETQKKVMEKSPHQIPAMFHMEGLCGAFIQDALSFPSGIGRGSSFDIDLEEKIGAIVSRQEKAVGITQIFAPVLDVTQDPRMGRQGETYGEDAYLAGKMGTAYTRGIQKNEKHGRKADACAKYFAGFHKSTGGIHGADVAVGERELREKFVKPFQMAIKDADLKGIMPCYCTMNGVATSANEWLLTDLLREELGFDGVVVSDYGAISNMHRFQGLYETYEDAGYAAMKAGMSVELPSRECYSKEMVQKFKAGAYDMSYLDKAVKDVLTAKFRMGLFENPFAYTGELLRTEFYGDIEADKTVSLQSARESMVLLKNDGTLPVSSKVKKIAVIGGQADNARFFFGGYTHLSMAEACFAAASAMAGVEMEEKALDAGYKIIPGTHIQSDDVDEMDELLRIQKPNCQTLLQELKRRLPEVEICYSYGYPIAGDDCSYHEEALAMMEGADLILFMLGGKHGSCSVSSMGEGVDGTDINLPKCQDILIEKAAKLNIPMVGVHMNGRPISSDIADRYLNAIIEAWNPSEFGAQAIAETLLGVNNPSGKMPVTTALHVGQVPIHYNHVNGSAWHQGDSIGFKDYVDMSHMPRYHFGHGLSYTTFSYENLTVEHVEITPDGKATISFDLKNTGKVSGTEVVQVYGRDPYASMVRPVMELIDFRRVTLEPGECRRVTFSFTPQQMAFLDENMNWKVEKGEILLLIGAASNDIRLETAILVKKEWENLQNEKKRIKCGR